MKCKRTFDKYIKIEYNNKSPSSTKQKRYVQRFVKSLCESQQASFKCVLQESKIGQHQCNNYCLNDVGSNEELCFTHPFHQ